MYLYWQRLTRLYSMKLYHRVHFITNPNTRWPNGTEQIFDKKFVIWELNTVFLELRSSGLNYNTTGFLRSFQDFLKAWHFLAKGFGLSIDLIAGIWIEIETISNFTSLNVLKNVRIFSIFRFVPVCSTWRCTWKSLDFDPF